MPKFKLYLRDKIIIAGIVVMALLIPTGTYVLSLRYKTESQAQEYKVPVTSPKTEATSSSRLQEALDRLNQQDKKSGGSLGETAGQTTTVTGTTDEDTGSSDSTLILGPTLGFSVVIQGRPLDNQTTRAFLGIAAGNPTARPTYLLSFMVNIPASGSFDGISLSGLDTGSTYTAYLKGDAQIATSSSFVVKATPVNLAALNLITGDVNEDNVVDNADYNLVKAAVGSNPSSSKWNSLFDFNLDNIINSWDLNIVLSNLGKIGASGAWYSYSPIATLSATLTKPSIGSESNEITPGTGSGSGPARNASQSDAGGYWMWVPN